MCETVMAFAKRAVEDDGCVREYRRARFERGPLAGLEAFLPLGLAKPINNVA